MIFFFQNCTQLRVASLGEIKWKLLRKSLEPSKLGFVGIFSNFNYIWCCLCHHWWSDYASSQRNFSVLHRRQSFSVENKKVIPEVVIGGKKSGERKKNTKHNSWIYESHAFFIDGNYEIYAGVRVTRDMLRWMIIKTHFARFGYIYRRWKIEILFSLSLHASHMIIIMIYSLSIQQEWIIFLSLSRRFQLFAVWKQKKIVKNILRAITRFCVWISRRKKSGRKKLGLEIYAPS